MRHDAFHVELPVLDAGGLELFLPLSNFQGLGHGNVGASWGICAIVDLPKQPRGRAH